MKKRKFKKILFLIALLFIISIFLYLRLKSYTYEVKYTLNNFKINESYNIDNNNYTFLIQYNGTIYPYSFKHKYIRQKELIRDIKIYKQEKETCLLPISNKLIFYPLCNNDEKIIMYNSSKMTIKDYQYKKVELNNINHDKLEIKYLNNKIYLLYNYKGFYYLKDNNLKNIKLFEKDNYTLNLIYQMNENIIVADYNKDHYFNKFYIINMNNGKLKELEFEYDISFDSIFLGDYKNIIYLLDKKEKKEYQINIKKLSVKESGFLLLKDNKLEKTTYKNIINNNLQFDNKVKSNYELVEKSLYQTINNYKVLITDKEVDKIIDEIDNTIYYLINENLYMYNNIYGEVLLISNFEWNFNNTNMIYLYK